MSIWVAGLIVVAALAFPIMYGVALFLDEWRR